MKKLRMDLDGLSVESFAVVADIDGDGGTVHAREAASYTLWNYNTCGRSYCIACRTIYDTPCV